MHTLLTVPLTLTGLTVSECEVFTNYNESMHEVFSKGQPDS